MRRRDFLGAMAATVTGLLVPDSGAKLLLPDWGKRVFPMFPRTHRVSIHEPLTGLFACKHVHWRELEKLVEFEAGWTNVARLRRAGWSVTEELIPEARRVTLGNPHASGLIYVPRVVFDTAPDGDSDWNLTRRDRVGDRSRQFSGEWTQNRKEKPRRSTYMGEPGGFGTCFYEERGRGVTGMILTNEAT